MKEFDYSEVRSYRFAVIIKPLFRFLTKVLMKVQIVGKENIPEEGGYILASNHISAPDPVYLYTTLKKPLHFMNKQEHFTKPILTWAYTHFNSFPINRGHSDKVAVEYAIKVIEHGNVLGIFPEGTRSKDYKPKQGKSGIALIARETKADILPVSIYSQTQAKLFTKITIRFGEMIPSFDSLGFTESTNSEELRNVTRLIMDRITDLWKKGITNKHFYKEQLLMKEFDYSNVKEYRFFDMVIPIFTLISKVFYRIKFVGKENVPRTGGVIIAANHYNTFDPGFISVSGVRKIHFMTKEETFAKPYPKWIYTHSNAFPIKRGGADKSAVEYAIKVVEQGYALGIFPEGTRSEDGIPQSPKAGVALIARETKADVIPVSIYSEGKAEMFSKIIVRFGEPIPYSAFGFTQSGKAGELRVASRLIMNEIIALREKKFEN